MKSMFSKAAFILILMVLSLSTGITQSSLYSQPAPGWMRLHGHFPFEAVASSYWKGRISSNKSISMTIALSLRNQQALKTLIDKLYDPSDPDYGKYLSTQEFEDNFAPTQADYDAVAGYIKSMGLTITGTHRNRMLLNVSGSAAAIESAFNLHLLNYAAEDGREFYAPDNDPEVPDFLAARVVGIVGLDNAAVWHAHNHRIAASESYATAPHQIGTGPGGGLTPSDVVTAYNLNSVAANGAGQTLALFELDGYAASDITAYENYYHLPLVPLQNVLVDGFSGKAGSGAGEVTLDIELQIALAPGASRILVYEGPNTNTGVIDTYNRIASDNTAKQISTSWGLSEKLSSSVVIQAESAIFQQMAAQGQSIYAASGDSGAYDNGATLSVDDPASQPYMVGVGGTQLFLNTNGTYNHETTWNVNNTIAGGAGGGGISSLWTIPSWQRGLVAGTSKASTTMRNVPDVSLNADQYTGYSIYYQGSWWIYGGTSCASPLWAAFTARINQQRTANSLPLLGYLNPTIYSLASTSAYGLDMHDIADSSTNLYYPAVAGYDDATGLGSINGSNLFTDLSSAPIVVPPPVSLAITSGPTASAARTSATVQWTTNLASSTVVKYGTSASNLSKTFSNNSLVTSHSAALSGLSRRTTYYFRVSSVSSSSTATSTVKSFTTQ
jgi:kumamolisin